MCIYPFYSRSFCLQPQDIDVALILFWKATHGVGDLDFDLTCRVLFKTKLHDWDVVRVLKDTSYISNTPHINYSHDITQSFENTQDMSHSGSEDLLLRRLTEDPRPFQQIFDRFVREVCVPRIAEVYQSAVGTGAYGDGTD